MSVHNHGTEEGEGLACREVRIDGALKGECLLTAMVRGCPTCNAQPGYRCTVPTDTGRRGVDWYHFKRDEQRA